LRVTFGKRRREQAENLVATGTKAVGVVLEVEDTGMTVNDNPRVRTVFRIEPLYGAPPFEAEKTKAVSRVQIPRAGDRYPVWFDSADPSLWAYATVDNDQGRESLRQMFGAVAETFTGVAEAAERRL
jgi:hypothetical protein